MILPIFVRPEAEAEIQDAYGWYEKNRQGLGDEFVLSFEACLFAIQRHPTSYPKVHQEIRRALLKRFPYGVFYLKNNRRITIIAVFHVKRNPQKWRERA